MSIFKAIKTLIRKNMLIRRSASCMAAIAMVVSLVSPASLVHAEDTNDQRQMEKIESFTGKLVKGASIENGRYVWTADHDADDHRFTFRVDYSMSGVHELEPGAIKIWIPKAIIKDRDGKYADYTDLSIPSEDEYKAASEEDKKGADYTWKDSTDEKHKNCIEITNVTERTAGENGYFEVSYITNKQTFEYQDYDPNNPETGKSDPFYADIQVTNTSDGTPQTVTASTDKIPVYINTTAEISSTTKKYPNRLYKEWQPSWGAQPEKTKGKYFLVWQIISDIKKPTQPHTFTLNDTPVSKELHLIGYSMDREAGPFTDKNYVTNQRTDNERYDYVLTYYDPADFKDQDQYELKNSVKATVTPEDKIDAPTSATSQKVWEWDTPKFTRPPGHFYGLKFGDGSWDHLGEYNQKYEIANTEWQPTYGPYHDYSSYSLDQLQDGKVNSLDTFAYGINVYGFPAPWTVDGDPFNPHDYQKKPVEYELTDEELYLHENIKAENTGADQLKFTIPEGAKKLDADDYQFLSARWQMHSEWRKFDDDEQKFVIDGSGKYSNTDVVHFWAKSKATGTDDYTEVASYNLGTGKAEIKNADVVASLDGEKIVYKDSATVTGIKFTTSNPYWFTNLSATPMVRLKNSKFVMDRIKDKDMIRLYNFSHSDAYDSDGKKLYGLKNYGYDRAIHPKRESELSKHIVSTGSNKVRKKYIIRWRIRQKETLTTDEGTDYLVQKSGKFYDLLPKGLHLQKGSIDIETEKGMLSHSSFSYSIEQDYKGSGRDMLTVNVPGAAKYYNFYFSSEMGWDAIKELGTSIRNPVAYETGNDDIYDGRPDDAYGMSDGNRGYMMGLDPKCTTNRFLYDEEPHDVDTLTAAVSGLKKQVKDSHDSSYSYSTYTTPNGDYSYKIRFANTMTDTAKDLIFFDSLENYNLNQKHSDWHGILKRFDTSQLKQMGIEPVVYVSPIENLSIDDHHDLTDTSVWQKVTDATDLSKMHAFAIDCRKTADGKDFVLNAGEALSAVVYMKAPASVSETKGQYAKAYNNIYIQDTIMNGGTESSFFIHQDYTEIVYRIAADIAIHKQNADNASESIEGAKYTLKGTSDYGTEVNTEATTGSQGDATFDGIEKGTYTLKETYSPSDWLLDKAEYTVTVDGSGKITCEKKGSGAPADKTEDGKIIMKDSPRIHGDVSFQKLSTVASAPVEGAKFRLSGKSKYGNDVMMYATSNDNGRVKFSDVEYGDYKMKEVETPDGYIPSSKEYNVTVSDTGVVGIDDVETLSDGTKVIRNEPYHTVEISKQSSYDDSMLKGAEFKLTGTSDYGTAYDKTAVSGDNGLAKFTGLEAGTYIVQETKAPKNYFLDPAKHIVKVNKNDTYTIDGLKKNDSGKYRQDNKPKGGKIIVYKKWRDNKTNAEREKNPPVIHITTDVNKVPTYAEWRDNYDSRGPFYYVDYNYESKAKKVVYADISADQVPANAVRLDKNYSDSDARFKIYGWLTDDGTMYYWTNAQTTRITDSSNGLFYEFSNAASIELSHIDTSKMTDMSEMFRDCSSLTSLDVSKLNTSKVTNMSEMFGHCSSLTSLDVSKLDTSKVTSMSDMFAGCSGLTSLDVSKLDTSKVTSMSDMFAGCSGLTSLDVSKLNTSNVTNMYDMFDGCSSLTSLDVSKLDTSKVTSMSSMFYRCSGLTSLDLSNFNTSNVTDMEFMFNDCSGLTSLDVSKLNTSNVTNMSGMFSELKLTSLDVSKLDTSNVTDMRYMFDDCESLTSLDVSKLDTSKVTNMSCMFRSCYKLTSLDVSKLDTSKVTDMSYMFYECKLLTSLDVSNFDTSNVTNMNNMFDGCSGLANIYVSDKWNTDKVTDSEKMFYNCTKLPNFDSSFNGSSSDDKTHANYGEGGYLTYKAYTATAKAKTTNTSFASRFVSMLMSKLFTPVYAADSASYVSTDPDHCKITKGSNIWTYEFSVADNSAKYYAYEDDLDGYTSSIAGSYGITTKDEPLTITNTADNIPEEPKPASLSLSKSVDGKQLIDKPAEKYSHTSNIDDTGLAHGTYKGDNASKNEIVTIPGASKLHVKLYYSTEAESSGTLDDWICVWRGQHPEFTAKYNYDTSALGSLNGKIGGGNKTSKESALVAEGNIDGDSVTFGFTSDPYVEYYGYYAIVTGYDADGNNVKAKKIADDSPTEAIPSFYADKTYMFDVTLQNSDSSKLSGTKIFGDAVFTDGKARVGLKAGEKKKFTGLPGSTTYTITEDKYDNFYTESKNASGMLNAGNSEKAEFTNHYQKPAQPDTPKEYNGFTLKKNVTGFYQNTQSYTFDVSFRKLDPNTKYTLSDGTKFTSDADGYGYAQVKLEDKESVKFTSLPINAEYRVTEEGGDWTSAYEITNSASDGDIAQSAGSAEKKTNLSTEWEIVDKGEDITVDYTNTVKKYQNLILKKAVTGGDAPGKFRFRVNFTNLHETLTSDAGTIVPDNGEASAEVYIGAGDQIEFKNVPVTTKYQITELANAGTASYTITTDAPDGISGGSFEKRTGENTEAMKDLSTAEETVDEGENATVTFLNTMPKSASVTLTKRVTGLLYDPVRYFRFTVSVANATRNQSYLIDLTKGSDMHDNRKNPQYLKTDENGHASADIWLKHNDTIVLKNLPLNAKYSIAEEKTEGYETTIKANGNEVGGISDRKVQADDIVFINNGGGILPTGIADHRNAIVLACAAIILATCSAFILFKRKRKLK